MAAAGGQPPNMRFFGFLSLRSAERREGAANDLQIISLGVRDDLGARARVSRHSGPQKPPES